MNHRPGGGEWLGRWTGFVAAIALGLAATAPALAASPGPVPTPSGNLLWADDFSSSTSGWRQGTMPSGGTFAYGNHEYLITPGPRVDDLAQAPYAALLPELIVSVEVSLPFGAAPTLRGGVICGRPSALDSHYVFFVSAGGDWSILRVDHGRTEDVLSGTLPNMASGTTIPLVAVCQDQVSGSQGTTTQLSFFIDGDRVASVSDTWPAASGAGWRSGLDAGPGATPPATVSFRHFAVSDASFGEAPPVAVAGDGYMSPLTMGVVAGLCVVGGLVLALFITRRERSRRAHQSSEP